MRDLSRQPALFADPDRFADAIEQMRGFVAHVRNVHAAVCARDLCQCDDFFGRSEHAGNVEEAGAQAQRSVLHALAHQAAHLVELLGVALRSTEPMIS